MEKGSSPAPVSVKRVLYATDFSRSAGAPLPYVLSLARRPGGKVIAVHVVSPGPLPADFPAHAWQAIVAQGVREAQTSMEQVKQQCRDVAHETRVCRGDVLTELSAIVRDESIDLIVLGTHGRTGISKAVFGSVAEKIFRHAPCPVLTVGPNVSGEPDSVVDLHTILFPTDFSPESLAALSHAVSLAREHQSRLYLLHVVAPEADTDEASLVNRLMALVPPAAGLACEPKAFVQAGAPAQIILDLAEELAVDLIVLGPKRRSGMPGTMATAYRVATQAICPVLTVRG
jgi:nucleotide-binding universal stress UspA family protein